MFDDLIAHYAARFDVPAKLSHAQMMQESAGLPRALNKSSGARGLMQFMPATASDLMYEPELAIACGVFYLSQLRKTSSCQGRTEEDNWKFALAAYNWGVGNIARVRKTVEDPMDFAQVYPHLPSETQQYVDRIWVEFSK